MHILYMNYIDLESIEDIKKNQKNIKNYIFREFEKKNDLFVATDKFFISEEIDNEMLEFNSFNINNSYKNKDIYERIIPDSNNKDIYILTNSIYNKYIDLIIVSNISFSFNEININTKDMINKILNNNSEFNEKIFEDLYYNYEFSNKINLELPYKYKCKENLFKGIDIIKKYLFKININNLDSISYQQEYIHI
jgi:hypothetical protein